MCNLNISTHPAVVDLDQAQPQFAYIFDARNFPKYSPKSTFFIFVEKLRFHVDKTITVRKFKDACNIF